MEPDVGTASDPYFTRFLPSVVASLVVAELCFLNVVGVLRKAEDFRQANGDLVGPLVLPEFGQREIFTVLLIALVAAAGIFDDFMSGCTMILEATGLACMVCMAAITPDTFVWHSWGLVALTFLAVQASAIVAGKRQQEQRVADAAAAVQNAVPGADQKAAPTSPTSPMSPTSPAAAPTS